MALPVEELQKILSAERVYRLKHIVVALEDLTDADTTPVSRTCAMVGIRIMSTLSEWFDRQVSLWHYPAVIPLEPLVIVYGDGVHLGRPKPATAVAFQDLVRTCFPKTYQQVLDGEQPWYPGADRGVNPYHFVQFPAMNITNNRFDEAINEMTQIASLTWRPS